MELDDQENVSREEASFGVELCLEKVLFFVYREGKPPVPKVRGVGSKKKRLSLLMISARKKRNSTATRGEGGGENELRGAEKKR